MCLGIEALFDLSIFTAIDKVKDRILYNKVWKDNWTCTVTLVNIIYYIVALLQYEYTSKEIIISLMRS
jgi:hypothetical protein